MSLVDQYNHLLQNIQTVKEAAGRKDEIKLIVVSKQKPFEDIHTLYQAGCNQFAENRIPEALEKQQKLRENIDWHFIGALQKNKVRKVVGHFSLIHSVDSFELAKKISEVSLEQNIMTKILLQVNTSKEESKQGLTEDGCFENFEKFLKLSNIEIQGLMTMAPQTSEAQILKSTFSRLRKLLEKINLEYQPSIPLHHLSMGMSNDYKIAIEEGATLLRIGSILWQY